VALGFVVQCLRRGGACRTPLLDGLGGGLGLRPGAQVQPPVSAALPDGHVKVPAPASAHPAHMLHHFLAAPTW
jgi:hypothetical protein